MFSQTSATLIMICRPLLSFALACLSTSFATAQYSDLVGRVPKSANTAVLINAEKLFASPIAQQGRWQQRGQAAFEAGLSALPADATAAVIAAQTDIAFGNTVWELSLVQLSDSAQVGEVARRFGGSLDTIDGKQAAQLPNDSYIVQLSDSVLASYTPSNRQDVSRWLQSTDIAKPQERYSSYLRQAFQYATDVGTPVIMAVDLQGAVSKSFVAQQLPQLKSFAAANLDADSTVDLIYGVQGITLGVTFTNQVNGAIRVDFSSPPDQLNDAGKSMLIEILTEQGAMIDDIRDWNPSVNGNTFLLSGPLSESGVRRILSVLELPASLAAAMDRVELSDDGSAESKQRVATQQYWTSLVDLIDDLREKPKRDGVKTFGQAAIWYGKYARKIDSLPILNVDPALIDFGAQTAQLLRNAEMSMKGVGMRSVAQTTGNSGGGGYGGSSYGGYRSQYNINGYGPRVTANTANRVASVQNSIRAEGQADTQIRTQERISGAASVQQIWQTLDTGLAAMRRDLTQRYQVEF